MLGLGRLALEAEALQLKRQRRADSIIAKLNQLHKDVDACARLPAASREQLKSDIRNTLMAGFGSMQEDSSFKTFKQATQHSAFFPGTHKDLRFVNKYAKESTKQPIKSYLTLKCSFPDIGVNVQGLPDMREASSIFEVKNRIFAEQDMLDQSSW